MSFRFNFVGRPPQVLSEDKTCEGAVCAGRMVELCLVDLAWSAVRFKFCLWAKLARGVGRFELCRLDLILSAVRFKFCLRTKLASGQGAGADGLSYAV